MDFTWADGQSPDPTVGSDSFSVRWAGKVRATKTGTYEFHTISDDGVRLWVNGVLLVDNWTDHAPTQDMGTIYLTGEQDYTLKLEYYDGGSSATIQLKWADPLMDTPQLIPASQLYPPSTDSVIYLHGDHLGSVSAASNSGGARISQQEYDPWGKLRPVVGSATTRQQTKGNYTGQKLDDTGLLFYNARYYDPGLGRFTSADSIVPGASFGAGGALGTVGAWQNSKLTVDFHETSYLKVIASENSLVLQKGFWDKDRNIAGPPNPQAINRYAYVLNNPLRYIDPTGHGSECGPTVSCSAPPEGANQTSNTSSEGGLVDGILEFLQGVVDLWFPMGSMSLGPKAYQDAKAGGLHSGTYKAYKDKPTAQIERAMQSHVDNFKQHLEWLKNPKAAIEAKNAALIAKGQKPGKSWDLMENKHQQATLSRPGRFVCKMPVSFVP